MEHEAAGRLAVLDRRMATARHASDESCDRHLRMREMCIDYGTKQMVRPLARWSC
jgi:hypothetical protein